MAGPTDLSSTIAGAAVAPLSATADGQSATARGADDLIKMDQYLALKYALANGGAVVYRSQIITPGAGPGRGVGPHDLLLDNWGG